MTINKSVVIFSKDFNQNSQNLGDEYRMLLLLHLTLPYLNPFLIQLLQLMMCSSSLVVYLAVLAGILFLVSPQSAYQSMPGLYIDRVSLANAVFGVSVSDAYYDGHSSGLLPISSPNTYKLAWRGSPLTDVSIGMSLHSYYFQNKETVLRYTAQIQPPPDSTWIYITLNTYIVNSGTYFYYMTFNIIAVANQSKQLEFITCERNFAILNKDNRGSPEFDTFYALSSKFYFLNPGEIQVYGLLQWIKYNKVDSNQTFQFTVNPVFSSSRIDIVCTSGEKNWLNSFKMMILVVNLDIKSSNIASFSSFKANDNYFSVPAIFANPFTQHNCFFTFSKSGRGYKQDYSFLTLDTSNNKVMADPKSTFELGIACFIVCPEFRFVISALPSQCQQCSSVIPSCLNCSSSTICTLCNQYAYLNSKNTCSLCRSTIQNCQTCTNASQCTSCLIGRVVIDGCTTVVGCTLVKQISYPYSMSVCTACDVNTFKHNATTNVCDCISGWLVGNYCTKVIGCISTAMQNSVIICNFCSIAKHYVLDPVSHTCNCATGYYKNDSGQCPQICGDGLVYQLQCDDGNTVDGDGCSSKCTVQTLYKCQNTKSAPSLCRFYGLKFSIELIDTQKVKSSNRAVFTFQFTPKLLNLAKLQLKDHFFFSCPNTTHSVKFWQYSDGIAKVYVDYNETFQEKKASVNFTFNNQYFEHTPIILNFTIASKGAKLYYYEYGNQMLNLMNYIVFGVSVAACLLVVVGSWFNKLVGVQYLHTLQIIYYCHFTFPSYTQEISIYQYLGFVGLNDRFFVTEQINVNLYGDFRMLPFSSYYSQVTIISVISFFIFSIIFYLFMEKMSSSQVQSLYLAKLLSIKQPFFSSFFFSITLSLTFPCYLTIASLIHQNASNSSLILQPIVKAILILMLAFIYSICTFQFFKHFLIQKNKNAHSQLVERGKKVYRPIYQFFIYSTLLSVWALVRLGYFECVYTLLALFVLMLLWQVIYKPYHKLVDNLGINLNLIFVILFLVLLILSEAKIIQINTFNGTLITMGMITLMLLTLILSIIRLIFSIKYRFKDKKQALSTEITQTFQNTTANSHLDQIQKKYKKLQANGLKRYQKYYKDRKPVMERKFPVEKNQKDEQFYNLVRMMKKQFLKKQKIIRPLKNTLLT